VIVLQKMVRPSASLSTPWTLVYDDAPIRQPQGQWKEAAHMTLVARTPQISARNCESAVHQAAV
jgi:hypothetical protein